jgi:hypothetical protein
VCPVQAEVEILLSRDSWGKGKWEMLAKERNGRQKRIMREMLFDMLCFQRGLLRILMHVLGLFFSSENQQAEKSNVERLSS